jgi:quercetin dioxygenase-like cupin family protein
MGSIVSAMYSLTGLGLTGGMATTDTTVRPGQTLENPVTGERFTFLHTAASTGGELLAFELGLRPGGAVPLPHVHPIQTERFEVLEGQMRFRLGWRHVVAGPGEVVEVAPGVVHGFANAGEDEVRVLVEVRPALRMERMFGEVVELAEAGRMTRRGLPRSPLVLARLARRYDQEAHAPLVTVRLQRLLLAPLLLLGLLLYAAAEAAAKVRRYHAASSSQQALSETPSASPSSTSRPSRSRGSGNSVWSACSSRHSQPVRGRSSRATRSANAPWDSRYWLGVSTTSPEAGTRAAKSA